MNIRRNIFWLKDSILGHHRIDKELNSVRNAVLNSSDMTERLNSLVIWAENEVPYYEKYKEANYDSLPVVSKAIIKAAPQAFMAKSYTGMKLHTESTSGSTGTPFTVSQDAGKRVRASVDSLFFSELAGFHLGTRLYYVRVWNNHNKKSKLQSLMTNIVMVDSSQLTDETFEAFVKQLENDHSEKSVLSYANTMTALYRWMVAKGRETTAKVACFITMSEHLPNETRKGLSELFHCPVVARYSNQECGLISQQVGNSDAYLINTASFFVQIFNIDKDEPVEDGKLGRIVVTDLSNRSMPMLKYDTGDLGVMGTMEYEGKQVKCLLSVEGRHNDFIYSTNGDMLSPVAVSVNMWKYQDLIQWQFEQNAAKSYIIRLCSNSVPYAREKELSDHLRSIVGNDADIKVEYVADLPLLASGKRKSVFNTFKQK